MKRNYILAVYLVALLISCKRPRQSESSNSWTDFRSQEGNFAAQFPQPPEDKLLDEEKDVVTTRSAKAVGEDVIYDTIYGSFTDSKATVDGNIKRIAPPKTELN